MKFKIQHILPFAIAALLPGLNFFSSSEFSITALHVLRRWLASSLTIYLLWYIFHFISLYVSRKYQVLLIALCIALFSWILYEIFLLPSVALHRISPVAFVFKVLSAAVLILIIQYALNASASIARLQIEKEQLLAEKYKVQLQELRTRVDPHFLFNTLNTLRSMIRKGHPQSEKFVMNLSGFYRQTLQFNESHTVSLKEELNVLQSYLFLMQTRNEGAIVIDSTIDERWMGYSLPAMSLQVTMENCFKHNRLSATEPLQVTVFSTEEGCIVVRNVLLPKLASVEKSGYGLLNVARIYELLGMADGLTVHQTTEFFEVTLKLIAGEHTDRRR